MKKYQNVIVVLSLIIGILIFSVGCGGNNPTGEESNESEDNAPSTFNEPTAQIPDDSHSSEVDEATIPDSQPEENNVSEICAEVRSQVDQDDYSALVPGADLRGCDLSGLDLSYVDISNTDLAGANLSNTNLTDTDFTNANLTNALFYKADLSKSVFASADVSGAFLFVSGYSEDHPLTEVKNLNEAILSISYVAEVEAWTGEFFNIAQSDPESYSIDGTKYIPFHSGEVVTRGGEELLFTPETSGGFAYHLQAWQPSGEYVIVGTSDGNQLIVIGNVITGETLEYPLDLNPTAMRAAWSNDGNKIAIFAERAIHIYEFPGFEKVKTIPIRSDVNKIAWSSTDSQIATRGISSDGGEIKIWGVNTGELVSSIAPSMNSQRYRSMAWSPDGQWLAISSGVEKSSSSNVYKNTHIIILDTETFTQVGEIVSPEYLIEEGREFGFNRLEWSQDGTILAATLDSNELLVFPKSSLPIP